MIRRPPRSTQGVSSAASDVYKRQYVYTSSQLAWWRTVSLGTVTVYRLPIRLPAKSALTWPVVELVAYKPSQYALVVLLRRRTRIYVQQYCTVNSLRSNNFHQFIISLLQVIRDIRMYIPPHSSPGGVPFPRVRTGTAAAVHSYTGWFRLNAQNCVPD